MLDIFNVITNYEMLKLIPLVHFRFNYSFIDKLITKRLVNSYVTTDLYIKFQTSNKIHIIDLTIRTQN